VVYNEHVYATCRKSPVYSGRIAGMSIDGKYLIIRLDDSIKNMGWIPMGSEYIVDHKDGDRYWYIDNIIRDEYKLLFNVGRIENIYVRGEILLVELSEGSEIAIQAYDGEWGVNIADASKFIGATLRDIKSRVAGTNGEYRIIEINGETAAYTECDKISIKKI